ncbi:MAG: glycosyltransferase involved in cell wall biosynthesis [Granulosicoccus sp.]|jgi:glycosyltransferase involved in cell wall biosynthesis
MSGSPKIIVIIPALNEEHAIGKVIKEIPDLVSEIIVADNNSKDRTSEVAKDHGAKVVFQPKPGYGNACLKAMSVVAEQPVKPEIIVFLDGDHSDFPEELPLLIKPIVEDGMDMVIGSRNLGESEPGSMTPQQIFGNWLATFLLKLIYGYRFTDLGPFRAIKYASLLKLKMEDRNYGWTVEMQIKAAKLNMKTCEVPVSYRNRIGQSKVSGTLKGSVLAGYKIIKTLFTYI